MSVLTSARMVDTFTDFVSDGERKKITTRTMASVTRSNNKLVLIHFPLLNIRNPLYHQSSSTSKGLPSYAIQMEVLLTGLWRLTLASNSFVAYYNTPHCASRRVSFMKIVTLGSIFSSIRLYTSVGQLISGLFHHCDL